jgi:hypothetical protein
MTNGTIKGETGTIGTSAINKDYIDVAYMDGDNEAKETS